MALTQEQTQQLLRMVERECTCPINVPDRLAAFAAGCAATIEMMSRMKYLQLTKPDVELPIEERANEPAVVEQPIESDGGEG